MGSLSQLQKEIFLVLAATLPRFKKFVKLTTNEDEFISQNFQKLIRIASSLSSVSTTTQEGGNKNLKNISHHPFRACHDTDYSMFQTFFNILDIFQPSNLKKISENAEKTEKTKKYRAEQQVYIIFVKYHTKMTKTATKEPNFKKCYLTTLV